VCFSSFFPFGEILSANITSLAQPSFPPKRIAVRPDASFLVSYFRDLSAREAFFWSSAVLFFFRSSDLIGGWWL